MEEEQRLRIEGIVSGAVGEIMDEVRRRSRRSSSGQGEPTKVVREYVGEPRGGGGSGAGRSAERAIPARWSRISPATMRASCPAR